jgi:hypothetical protein
MQPSVETRRSRGYRAFALVFVAGMAIGLTCGEILRLPHAEAQIPDAGKQRLISNEELQQTNQLLRELLRLLRTETLNVKVVEDGKTGPGKSRPLPPPPPPGQ